MLKKDYVRRLKTGRPAPATLTRTASLFSREAFFWEKLMTVLDTVRTRYTTKHYDAAKRIPEADFNELLEVLRLSPTSVNAQLTQYLVADTPEAKARIAPAFWDFNRPRVTDASHCVVFVVPESVSDEHLKEVLAKEEADGRLGTPEVKADQDAGRRRAAQLFSGTMGSFEWAARQAYIAMGFLLFAAAQKGIDSTPFEGFDAEELDKILGLKEKGLRSVCCVSLGYRAANDSNASRPKSRLALDRLVTRL